MNSFHFLKQKEKNKPNGKIFKLDSVEEVAKFIIKNNYSVGFYNPPQRSELNWRNTNVLILDIDDVQPNNKSIEDISSQLKSFVHIVAPTKSHQIPKGTDNHINDRYRILLFLDRYIYDISEYKVLINEICRKFDIKTDSISKDPTHFFYSSLNVFSTNSKGNFLKVDDYLLNALPLADENKNEVIRKSEFKYKESDLLIPTELATWIFEINSKPVKIKRERFIRILMSQKDFVSYDSETGEIIGHGRNIIPQVFLSEYLKIETKTLRRWINNLVERKQLELVGVDYGKGWKCKEYKAMNDLENAVIATYYKNEIQSVNKYLPTTINDGEWEKELIKAAWHFVKNETPDNFYNWANSLPTLNEKRDRKFKVERAWKSAKKRLALLIYTKIDT